MPISREDFKRGRTEDSDEEKILRLLDANPGRAYSAKEIAKEIGHKSAEPVPADKNKDFWELARGIQLQSFGYYLDSLVLAGKAESSRVRAGSGSEIYYAARP